MKRSRSRPKLRPRGRDRLRHVFMVLAAIGVLLVSGAFTTNGIDFFRAATVAAAAPHTDEAYSGSILFTPYEGNNCHQILFDNRTGRLSDNGKVDCDQAALAAGEAPRDAPTVRVRVISLAFRQR